jgi:hypothetical protein
MKEFFVFSVHGNELSGSSGEIASPMFPHTYLTGSRPGELFTFYYIKAISLQRSSQFQIFNTRVKHFGIGHYKNCIIRLQNKLRNTTNDYLVDFRCLSAIHVVIVTYAKVFV